MAKETIQVGPPFKGMSDYPDERGIQAVRIQNHWINNGHLIASPKRQTLDAARVSDRGIYVSGVKETAVIVTLGTETGTGHIIYRASRDVFAVEVDLTDYYTELPTRQEPYWFATLGRKVYFGAGQQVFVVDPQTLEPSPMELSTGRESQTVAYLNTSSIPARAAVAYQGRMWYALAETKDFNTSITIDPSDPLVKDPDALVNGMVRYTPQQILFSDPYEPDHLQWYASFDIDDAGCQVTGLVPWQSALLILTTKGLWLLEGDSPANWTLRQVNQYADCAAPRSIVATNDAVVWWGVNSIWRLSGEGLLKYPGLDWVFDIEPSSLLPVSRLLSSADSIWSGLVTTERISGAAWNGGTHALFSCARNLGTQNGGMNTTVAVEIASGEVSLFQSAFYVAFDASASRLFGKVGGLLVGNIGLQYHALSDQPDVSQNYTYLLRLVGDPTKRRNTTKETLQLSRSVKSATCVALSIDEAVRYTASGVMTEPDYANGFGQTVAEPPGGASEGSVYSDGTGTEPKWVGTPAAGQVRPRYSHGTPVIVEFEVQVAGRDIGTGFQIRSANPYHVEGLVLEVETEQAP